MAKKKEAKERILESAFSLFTSYSYDKVSIDEIAKKAGVSKGGLFHHFESKYALARDALIWFAEKNMGELLLPEYIENTSPEKQLKKFIDVALKMMVEDIKLAHFFMNVFEEALHQKQDIDVWTEFLNNYLEYVQRNYEKMKVPNPRMKALLLMSCLDGFALYHMFLEHSDESININKLRKEVYKMFIG